MLANAKSLIQESWMLYKKNFSFFAKIVAWLLAPAVILSILPSLGLIPAILLPLNFLFSLVSLVLGLFISIALILTVNGLWKQEKPDLKTVYNVSYSKILSYFWVSILVGLAVLGGTILLIIPGIIFSVWFSFSLYIVILENIKGTKALSASKALTKGYFWPILWRWFAPYFVYGVILTVIILIPIYVIGAILGEPGAGFAPITPWWSALISNIFYIFTVPLFVAIGVILYNSLKKEKEAAAK